MRTFISTPERTQGCGGWTRLSPTYHPRKGLAAVRRPLLLALSVAILAGLFAVPAAEAKSVKLKAMTRNLYLGTDT
jgi:hypothetical protein